MAATKTLPQRAALRKLPQTHTSQIEPKNGVVTLFGYGIKVRVDRGHLILEDGIGGDRQQRRFARVGHGLERLVVIGNDGIVSLAGLRWLTDQKAAFIMLERDGSVVTVTGPVSPSDARLRRSQAVAHSSGAALVIARELIGRKLAGQEHLARTGFRNSTTADAIAGYRAKLPSAPSIESVRLIEANAAKAYWSAFTDVPIQFPKRDLARVPAHWRTFGARQSPLTGSGRRAVSPANTMLNYLYAILEAESRLAIAAMGLDPGLGFIHFDSKTRDSLACDLMEAVRPEVDAFVLDWIKRVTLKREWFFEQRDGTCRLMASFAGQLSQTARMWRAAVAPLAEWLAQTLWSSIRKPRKEHGPATRLTHGRSRAARGLSYSPGPEPVLPPQSVCRVCGTLLEPGRKYCLRCFPDTNTERIVAVAPAGWLATQSANAQALRAASMRRHEAGKAAWDADSHPKWLTEAAYRQRIQPLLKKVSTSRISTALGVTWAYASNIRRGERIPHPRHWQALAELVGATARN
jgi:CRISPR-associated protein Cas1